MALSYRRGQWCSLRPPVKTTARIALSADALCSRCCLSYSVTHQPSRKSLIKSFPRKREHPPITSKESERSVQNDLVGRPGGSFFQACLGLNSGSVLFLRAQCWRIYRAAPNRAEHGDSVAVPERRRTVPREYCRHRSSAPVGRSCCSAGCLRILRFRSPTCWSVVAFKPSTIPTISRADSQHVEASGTPARLGKSVVGCATLRFGSKSAARGSQSSAVVSQWSAVRFTRLVRSN